MNEGERVKRVSFETRVKVSRCDGCGVEERAIHGSWASSDVAGRVEMYGNSWHFPTHVQLKFQGASRNKDLDIRPVGDDGILKPEHGGSWTARPSSRRTPTSGSTRELDLCLHCAASLASEVRVALARLQERRR